MRSLLFIAVALYALPGWADGVPDLECREERVLLVDPRSLSTQQYEGTTRYRIKAGSLYLAPSDRPEYLYGKLVETEPSRFIAGHKTFQLDRGPESRSASVVHTYHDEVRVSQLSCTRR